MKIERVKLIAGLLGIGLLFAACGSSRALRNDQPVTISSLQLLNNYIVPHHYVFQGTTVGGLSGIDYNPVKDEYYLISDDRSALNPARFYTARILLGEKGIDSVQFLSTHPLLAPDGNPYPNSKTDPSRTPDPEAIRYNPRKNLLTWSSEGERITRGKAILEDPAVNDIDTTGKFIDSFQLPANLHMHATEKGPRQNGVFEGLSYANHYRQLYVNVEEPLYEDGPRAGTGDSSAWVRIIRFSARTHKPRAQYAYRIDPVVYPANPPGAFKINGVPDILFTGRKKLLVMERSYSTGRRPCNIRIYQVSLKGARRIRANQSLQKDPPDKPLQKTLLLNLDNLGMYTDNIEGMTLGPLLPNGHRSLVLVSDDNFSPLEQTQFWLFEIIP